MTDWTRMLALHVEPGDITSFFGTNHRITEVKQNDLDMEFILEAMLSNWMSPTPIIVTMNEMTQVSILRKSKESP